jgi:hypothetical protein
MKKRPPARKEWMPITSSDGALHGQYEVSDGWLTVSMNGRTKGARASSTSVPGPHGFAADQVLARIMLHELV